MSSISIHCSHLWRGVSSTGSISMAEAAVRGQRPGVTRLRIIASPHSLLLKRLLEPCDLIMMWFLLFFFSLSSHHRWKQTCLTDTVNFIDLLGVNFFFSGLRAGLSPPVSPRCVYLRLCCTAGLAVRSFGPRCSHYQSTCSTVRGAVITAVTVAIESH